MIFKKIIAVDFVRFFTSGALLTLLKLLAILCVNKVIALSVGPSGYGEIAQLLGSVATIVAITSAPTGNGLIRYVAECKKNGDNISTYVHASVLLAALLGVVTCAVLFLCVKWFVGTLFYGSSNNASYFNMFLILLPVASLSQVIPSYLNGMSLMKEYVLFSARAYLGYIIIFVAVYFFFGISVALYVAATSAAILSAFYAIQSVPLKLFNKKFIFGINSIHLKRLSKYSLMAITSTACAGGSQILLREFAANTFDWATVGNWQAISRISDAYLSFVFMGLSTYILPKLINSSTNSEKNSALKLVLFAIVIFFLAVSFCYLPLYKEILSLLYSDKFDLPFNAILLQIVGDLFKFIAWLLTYIIIASGNAIQFVIIELVFTSLGLVTSIYLMNVTGFLGIFQAYLITNIAAASFLYLLFRYGKL